jgi:flagellin
MPRIKIAMCGFLLSVAFGSAYCTTMKTSQVKKDAKELGSIPEMQSALICLEVDLKTITVILQRIRVLAVQSANGIYTDDDRYQISLEQIELSKEILRIKADSYFRETPLLNSSNELWPKNLVLRLSKFGDPILFSLPDLKAKGFGLISWDSVNLQSNAQLTTPGSSNSTIGIMDDALTVLGRERARVGALYNRLEIAKEREDSLSQIRNH